MVLEAPPRPTEISLREFEEWTENCGVKKAQREYEQMALEGKAHGRSAVEEMHHRGFKDFNHFQKACQRFDLRCWPTEFAELGSGYVLYFQFLAALAAMMAALLLLQLPAVVSYAQEDYICGWYALSGDAWETSYRTSMAEAAARFECPPGSSGGASQAYLTPGNFGPDQAVSAVIPTLYTVCVGAICVCVFYAYQVFVATEKLVDANTTSPGDFALMVSGLPALATDETALMQWFRENALRDKRDTEIVKVVIGWDAEEFREKIERIRELKKQMQGKEPADPEVEELKKKIREISSDLSSSAPDRASRLRSSGSVVVVFRYQCDHKACLARWTSFWARWLYCDAEDLFCLAGARPGPSLPRFPVGNPPQPVMAVKVQQAAEPGDIVWEHLGVPRSERLKRFALTWAAMGLVILVSFLVAWGLVFADQKSAEQTESVDEGDAKTAWKIVSLVPSVLILINNMAIAQFAKWLGSKEYHDTKTEMDFSQALKMSIGMIVNTAGVLYWCKATPREWYTEPSLVSEVFLMMAVNAIVAPMVNAVDIGWRIKAFYRPWGLSSKKLTQEKMDKWNETVRQLAPKKKLKTITKEEEQELDNMSKSIEFYKRAYTPSVMRTPRSYANALKTFVCCVFYSPLIPMASFFGLAGIILQYLIDKYLLLTWYKRPERPANGRMATFSLLFIKYVAPGSLSLAMLVFLMPSWGNKQAVMANFFIAGMGALVFAFLVPLNLVSQTAMRCAGCIGYSLKQDSAYVEQDYYQAQYMWSKEMKYHKDQFLYKKLPEAKNPEHLQQGTDAAIRTDDLRANFGSAAQGMADAVGASHGVVLRGGLVTQRRGSIAAPGGDPQPAAAAVAGTAGWAQPAPAVIGAPAGGKAPQPQPTVVDMDGPSTPQAPSLAASSASTVASAAGAGSAGGGAPAAAHHGGGGAAAAVEPAAAAAAPVPGALPGSLTEPGEPAGGRRQRRGTRRQRRGTRGDDGDGGYVWEYKWEDDWDAFADDCQKFIESRYQRYKDDSRKEFITVNTKGMQVTVNFEKMTTKKKGSHDIREIRRRRR